MLIVGMLYRYDINYTSLLQASNGSLRERQAESFGALWVVDQVAQRLGIKKALGVTHEAELSYWQVLARVLRPGTSLLAMVRLAGACAAAALLVKKELGCRGVTLVGDRGMIRSDQKEAAQKAEFHFITALTKPQIQKLLADKVLQAGLAKAADLKTRLFELKGWQKVK